ncbi:AAA family ATPase [Streptacidiphilus jiangxiensis]|uniref:AAA domain (Dynein-related subfamily) n=1 Tax=Streptacidiphilus jiangxiensis TaxID=235985 RepID=A0A1H7G692_STRJI|nr:MoxR family ATPase [Streptacidiphilus jiangxiensis]SEK32322.1 AAA domain (dynein-related subfamily) [Streptacidiphilus jiangxiensis]
MNERTSDWLIYRGVGEPHNGVGERLPDPPPWRAFVGRVPDPEPEPPQEADQFRRLGVHAGSAGIYQPTSAEVEAVNAALYLRRPLLITGAPGVGKSTLAYAVAHELKLGRVLRWPIVSSSVLQEGLYSYDAVGRLQDANLRGGQPRSIGSFLRLGPLGTALLPASRPRVILVDELDKSDIDLPNNLLNVLEEGTFGIPELARIGEESPAVEVLTDDPGRSVTVEQGQVACHAFPLVMLTSNGEREFPYPLLRRCIQLQVTPPDARRLAAMVRAHLGEDAVASAAGLIGEFLERSHDGLLATDQLLNAIYLTQQVNGASERTALADRLMQRLDRPR